MFVVHIDKQNEIWTLHRDSCRSCPSPNVKGEDSEEPWIYFESVEKAFTSYLNRAFWQYEWQTCKECNPMS